MDTTTSRSEAPAGPGHNNPPEPTIAERLTESAAELLARIDTIAEKANAAPATVEDDETLAKIGEIVVAASQLARDTDKVREAEKAPFLKGGREVDGFFKAPLERLKRITDALTKRANVYNAAKAKAARDKQAAEEAAAREAAAKAKAEAETALKAGRTDDAMAALEDAAQAEQATTAAAAPVKTADAVRIHTDTGVTITAATVPAFEITDYDAIPLDKLKPYFKREEVEKAIRAFMRVHKAAGTLAGVRFYEAESTQFRG